MMSHVMGWAAGVTFALVGIGGPMWWLASSHDDAPEPETPQLPRMDDPSDAKDPQKKTEFATGGADDKTPEIKFDGAQAVKYVKELCDIGPRVSGSDGIKKQQELIEKHFKKLGATVTRQEFKAKQNSR